MQYEKFWLVARFVLSPETKRKRFCGWGEPGYFNRRK